MATHLVQCKSQKNQLLEDILTGSFSPDKGFAGVYTLTYKQSSDMPGGVNTMTRAFAVDVTMSGS